jgi:hypothetical protein
MKLTRLDYTQHPRPPQRELRQRGVFDSGGRLIGYVANIYVDEERTFRFVDVAMSGLMGFGRKHHLLPVEAIAEEEPGSITLTVDQQTVESALILGDSPALPDETMNLRVTTMRVLEGHFDRILRFIRESIIPATEMQEGFCGGVLTSDRRANMIVTISLWNREARMQASERCHRLPDQITRLVQLLAELPEIENYQLDTVA